MDIKKGNKLRL